MSQLRQQHLRQDHVATALQLRPPRLRYGANKTMNGLMLICFAAVLELAGFASFVTADTALSESHSVALDQPSAAHLPQPFQASYTADYRGLPISATGVRSFFVNQDDEETTYTFSSKALSLFAKLYETSTFSPNGAELRPLRYQYERTGLGKNKTQDLQFNWVDGVVTDQTSSDQYSLNREARFSDRLLYQLQLQVDLFNAPQEDLIETLWTYDIFDAGRIKQYVFQVIDQELLETALGPIQTLRLEKRNDDSEKRTALWLAPEFEYMLVRFIQEDGRNSFSLELKEASIAGQNVRLED